jgi:hypothetical protein
MSFGGIRVSSPISGNSPRTFDWYRGESRPTALLVLDPLGVEQQRPQRLGHRLVGEVRGVERAEMPMTFHPEPGLQTFANSVFGSSGFPIARMRQSALVVIASTAVHSCSGMPHASSRMTRT